MDRNIDKTEKVLITCITNEVEMAAEPVSYFSIERVHVIRYARRREGEDKRANYYDRILESLEERLGDKVEVVIHSDDPTYSFDSMMAVTYNIIKEEQERGSLVYVNISSGTMEYAAAASIASMMHRNVKVFTMGAKEECLTQKNYDEKLKSITHEGRIVGTSYGYHDPFSVNTFPLDPPDLKLVKALKIFSLIEMRQRTNTNVIRNLILNKLWINSVYADDSLESKIADTSLMYDRSVVADPRKDDGNLLKFQRKEAVQYQRNYIDRWTQKGWIYKDPARTGSKYDLTDAGLTNLKVFSPMTAEEEMELKKSLIY